MPGSLQDSSAPSAPSVPKLPPRRQTVMRPLPAPRGGVPARGTCSPRVLSRAGKPNGRGIVYKSRGTPNRGKGQPPEPKIRSVTNALRPVPKRPPPPVATKSPINIEGLTQQKTGICDQKQETLEETLEETPQTPQTPQTPAELPEDPVKAPALDKRKEIRREILETERNYVESLQHLRDAYIIPLQASNKQISPILSAADLSKLFSSIELIVNVNEELLASLELILGEQATVEFGLGDVFLKFAPYLKLYNQYSANYDEAAKALDQFKKENNRFAAFLEASALSSGSEHTEISFYLIMPIQRIPRYIMLLSDLLKYTKDEADHENISSALHKIKEVATNVNNSIREAEHINKLLEMEENLVGFEDILMIPSRRLLREGLSGFSKISIKGSLAPRLVFLFNDILILTEKKTKAGKLVLKEHLKVHLSWVKSLPDADKFKNVFQIASNKSTIVLSVNTAKERDEWVQAINNVRQQLIGTSKVLAQERTQVESYLQPRLHAKYFQIDEFVDQNTKQGIDQPQRAKRTRNANSMIQSLSKDISHSSTSGLYDLSEECLQKFESLTASSTVEVLSPRGGGGKGSNLLEHSPSSNSNSRRLRSDHSSLSLQTRALRIPVSVTRAEMSGFLTKTGGKRQTKKKRWFVLKSKFMCYYKTKQDDIPLGVICLQGYSLEISRNKKNSFHLVKENSRTYNINASSEAESVHWISAIDNSFKSSNSHLDHESFSMLIGLIFLDQEKCESASIEAAGFLKVYLECNSSDSSLIEYLASPSSFKPLRKLLGAPEGIATPVQISFLKKLRMLALVEEVGKSLIAHGLLDCLYSQIKISTKPELIEPICCVLGNLSRFDFFPYTDSLKVLFPLLKPCTDDSLLYHISTILKNAAPVTSFRKVFVAERALSRLYDCFSTSNERTVAKFLQAFLLLICDVGNCSYSDFLFSRAISSGLSKLTSLLLQPVSNVHWNTMKVVNLLVSRSPVFLQSLDVSHIPPIQELFISDKNPGSSMLVFELTRFFNMISRNHWIRGSLDNNSAFLGRLIEVLDKTDKYPLKEVALRCISNLCTSDKNKTSVAGCGVDVLLRQLTFEDLRVHQKAMYCIHYVIMNEKGKRAFCRPELVDEITKVLEVVKHAHSSVLNTLALIENSLSPTFPDLLHMFACAPIIQGIRGQIAHIKRMDEEESKFVFLCQAIRSVSCLAFSDEGKKWLAADYIPLLTDFLQEAPALAIPSAGALGNIFHDISIKENEVNPTMITCLFGLLSISEQPRHISVVLNALTCISYQSQRWAKEIFMHNSFCVVRDILQTGAEKQIRHQCTQLLASLYAEIMDDMEEDLIRATQNVNVELVYYRPRFEGYKIV